MNELTLDGLAVPLRALRLLSVDFGHLPAPEIDVSTIYPDQLALRFHNGLNGFEAWRAALGIAPDAVELRAQGAGTTWRLQADADYGGAHVHLVGYASVPPGADVHVDALSAVAS
ncbi:hypothetical protein ACFYZ9_21490 [Streptomyces sp. NPDC001691]|uniref:hypothetical protein n=1 Tax=Streptomyces sp. NPDC001691 TaxID=3364600 RepID=UPI00368DA08A